MKKKILLVDDVKLFLKLEETFFKRTGCDILMADSGEKALKMATDQSPDLILLDYIMPDLMGDEVIRRLKANTNTSNIPIIMVTTSADEGDMEKCFKAGADEYVTKPINPQEILAKAATMLDIPQRVHCRTQVRFRVEGSASGRTFSGYTKNISRGGLLLECGEMIDGNRVELDLPILPGKSTLTVNGEIVRTDHDAVKDCYYLGVQFQNITQEIRSAVDDFIKRTQPPQGSC